MSPISYDAKCEVFFFLLLKVVSLKMVIKVKTHALSCSGTMNEFHSGCCGERKKKKGCFEGCVSIILVENQKENIV